MDLLSCLVYCWSNFDLFELYFESDPSVTVLLALNKLYRRRASVMLKEHSLFKLPLRDVYIAEGQPITYHGESGHALRPCDADLDLCCHYVLLHSGRAELVQSHYELYPRPSPNITCNQLKREALIRSLVFNSPRPKRLINS